MLFPERTMIMTDNIPSGKELEINRFNHYNSMIFPPNLSAVSGSQVLKIIWYLS